MTQNAANSQKVGPADRLDDRQEESADQERRAPVDAAAYAGSMTTFVLTGVRE